jgi:signal transduction histidine kinase
MSPAARISALIAVSEDGGVLTLLDPDIPEFAAPEEFLRAPHLEPGLVLVGPGLSVEAAARLAERLEARGPGWTVVTLARAPGGTGYVGRRLSVVGPRPLDDVLQEVPSGPTETSELERVLSTVARARHDINNPLTTALAETQLLLMDATDAEVREALETIQRQIRRIRDLVADLAALRPST